VTLLPSVREQLEDAAARRGRPAHVRRAGASWNPWAGRAALALTLVVTLAAVVSAPNGASSGGVHATQPPTVSFTPRFSFAWPGERLRAGEYAGTVAMAYAEHPALLEDSEMVYRPVGGFHVRVP
jgi:hypothetical protein